MSFFNIYSVIILYFLMKNENVKTKIIIIIIIIIKK
jgi:hypothetical protein